MQKHRYKVSFFLTALLYIIPTVSYLYFLQQHFFTASEPKESVIELSLSQFVPEAVPQSETVIEEVVEETVEEEPEPVVEKPEETEPPKPEPEPEPEKPEPILKEMPVVKPVVQKKKHVSKQVRKKKPVKKTAKKHTVRRKRHKRGGTPHYSTAQKNRFLAQIRHKIEKAKSYPRIARKRRMQGVVRVHFTILKSGKLGRLTLKGPKIFYASARKAVQSAFPVNVKKATIQLPATVNLSLRYKLR